MVWFGVTVVHTVRLRELLGVGASASGLHSKLSDYKTTASGPRLLRHELEEIGAPTVDSGGRA